MADQEKKKVEVKELQKEVAEKFNVKKGIGVGEVKFKGRTIHLDSITLKQAEELFEAGFNVLVPKKVTSINKI